VSTENVADYYPYQMQKKLGKYIRGTTQETSGKIGTGVVHPFL
jgi:hypothetical protein